MNEVFNYDFLRDLENALVKWPYEQVRKQIECYSRDPAFFGNKVDFTIWKPLLQGHTDLNTIAIAGVNHGDSIQEMLTIYPDAVIHGFEVVESIIAGLHTRFRTNPNVHIYHLGLSDDERQVGVHVENEHRGELSGIFQGTGDDYWSKRLPIADYKVKTVALQSFFSATPTPLLYVLIDVEGHEANVIKGMGLEHPSNQEKFPVFQYELGGTWRDTRHNSDMPNQFGVAMYLASAGYNLYIIGQGRLLQVFPEFFRGVTVNNEGSGFFVQGNCLAVHSTFSTPSIRQQVQQLTIPL